MSNIRCGSRPPLRQSVEHFRSNPNCRRRPALNRSTLCATIGSRRAFSTARTSKDRCAGMGMTAAGDIIPRAATDPFLCSALSAHKRVIADVASSSVQGRRSNCTDARRSNADTAVNITGDGGSARIGVLCEMSRGYMARASHSGSCEHGCGDQCSRQKFKLSHLISPLHEKPTACGSFFWLHDDQR
jgi:hypothetical protein